VLNDCLNSAKLAHAARLVQGSVVPTRAAEVSLPDPRLD